MSQQLVPIKPADQDSTLAIRQAVKNASVSGGQVRLATAIYKTTAEIGVPPNVQIIGEGCGSIIHPVHPGIGLSATPDPTTLAAACFADFTIKGFETTHPEKMLANGKTELDYKDVGISVVDAHRTVIERVNFQNIGRTAIYVKESYFAKVMNCNFWWCGVGPTSWSSNNDNNSMTTSGNVARECFVGADNFDGGIKVEACIEHGVRIGMPGLDPVACPSQPGVMYRFQNFYAEANAKAQKAANKLGYPLGDVFLHPAGKSCGIDFNGVHWATNYGPDTGYAVPAYNIVAQGINRGVNFSGGCTRKGGKYTPIYCREYFGVNDSQVGFLETLAKSIKSNGGTRPITDFVAGGGFVEYTGRPASKTVQ